MRLTFTQSRSSVTGNKAIRNSVFKGCAILLFAFFAVQQAKAQVVYAISSTGNLVSFNSSAPGTILSNVPLTGIAAGQVAEGLDFRPSTGQLYTLGYNATNGQTQVYTIKVATGVASPVGSAITLATGMSNLGVDFNPVPDLIRVTSSTRQNYRLNPNNGTLTASDGTITYAGGDANAAATPNVVAVAYTNAVAGATTTTLYCYDFSLNNLGTINPPNNGTVNTAGSSGITANNAIGLDLDITTDASTSTNTAYLSADVTGSANNFYSVDLVTGAATLIGSIGGGKITEMAVSLPAPVPARNKLVYAVQGSNLISFNSSAPATILSTVAITGLGAGETILGLDFRPATGQLYALGSASRLYIINLNTGAATQVGTDGAFVLNGTKFGFDFNPVPDRIRVVSNTEQNLRLNPNDGTLTGNDNPLAYAAGDPNAGANPTVGAVAYVNSYAGATTTTLYFYDYDLQRLGTINPPNDGKLNTVGGSGVVVNDQGLDMDISSDRVSNTNTAFFTGTAGLGTTFYRLNLSTGAVTAVGTIGGGSTISAMAVYLPPPPPVKTVYAVTSTGNLISFYSNIPGNILSSVAITGITAGQAIEGLDFRPANNQLYAVGYNPTTGQTQVYTIDPSTGAATTVGSPITLGSNMGRLAVDFNPQVDRIRVVSSTGMNYRLNPNDGSLTASDTPLTYAAGDLRAGAQPNIHAVAYTNNFAGTTSTGLYYYDFSLDNLATTNVSPNSGELNTVGYSGISALSAVDMDIVTNLATGFNVAFLTADVTSTASNFYTIDLRTAETKLAGTIGGGNLITEMAVGAADVVLPVALTSFSVKKAGLTSELSWTTQSEVNNDHFIIERSSNGRTFTSISGKINSKAGNGNSTRELSYSYTDLTPVKGTNYYRLLQADKDGNIKYSNILKVTFDGRYEIKLYPNPVVSVLNINGYISDRSDLNVKISDGSGKAVIVRDYKNQQGNWSSQIPAGNLPAGVYYVQISQGTTVIHTQALYKN